MAWALKHAPVMNAQEHVLLIALADRADDGGRSAWPSQRWLAQRGRCSDRTVRRHLSAMEARGLLRRGDQRMVEHLPVDRRPIVWDLNMALVESDVVVNPETPSAARTNGAPDTPDDRADNLSGRSPVSARPGHSYVRPPRTTVSDNTSLNTSLDSSVARTPDKPSRKKPAIRLPDDWEPTAAHREFAAKRGLDLDAEARKFRLHAEENDRRVVVWNSAFSRWLESARPRPVVTSGVSESGRLWQD
ncbi:helix-turn-helix domain-containing protein [Nocardia sp. NPDC051463]|uniref:helix-turn-helix domain-containing protein n=1 Tax=Nocardia sp. NPDC051463 TaxID=3154845 RepID=UPI00344B5D65